MDPPPLATAPTPSPSGIACVGPPRLGSNRRRDPPALPPRPKPAEIHIDPAPVAVPVGGPPTPTVANVRASDGSTRESVRSVTLVTHTYPLPTATPLGRCPPVRSSRTLGLFRRAGRWSPV